MSWNEIRKFNVAEIRGKKIVQKGIQEGSSMAMAINRTLQRSDQYQVRGWQSLLLFGIIRFFYMFLWKTIQVKNCVTNIEIEKK